MTLRRMRMWLVTMGTALSALAFNATVYAQDQSHMAITNDVLVLQSIYGTGSSPLIAAMIGVCKPFILDNRWIPPIALVLGIGMNEFIAVQLGSNFVVAFFYGITAGLAACGLYSAGKTLGAWGNNSPSPIT